MSIDGTYQLTLDTPNGQLPATLNLVTKGSSLSGDMSVMMRVVDFDAGTVDGSDVSWSLEVTDPTPMTVHCTATVDGDSITGRAEMGPFGAAAFRGSRALAGVEAEETDEDEVADVRMLRFQLAFGSPFKGPVRTALLTGRVGMSPGDIVDTLVDSERHSALVGHPVKVKSVVGAHVRLGPDQGDGYLMEYIENSHVSFALHPRSYPEGHYSTVTVMAKGDQAGGSNLTIYQQNVPEELVAEVRDAWERDYLTVLRQTAP
jgi:hypothetical protein